MLPYWVARRQVRVLRVVIPAASVVVADRSQRVPVDADLRNCGAAAGRAHGSHPHLVVHDCRVLIDMERSGVG